MQKRPHGRTTSPANKKDGKRPSWADRRKALRKLRRKQVTL